MTVPPELASPAPHAKPWWTYLTVALLLAGAMIALRVLDQQRDHIAEDRAAAARVREVADRLRSVEAEVGELREFTRRIEADAKANRRRLERVEADDGDPGPDPAPNH